MKLNVKDSTWIEISVTVFMYGGFLLTIEQSEEGVNLIYTNAPDGASGNTNEDHLKGEVLSSLLDKISEIDFDISSYDDEGEYVANDVVDGNAVWSVSFGKQKNTDYSINGDDVHSNVLKLILSAIKDLTSLEFIDEFMRQFYS